MQRRDFLGLTLLAGAAPLALRARPLRAAPRVVVIGGGFGGSACALHLKERNAAIDVTLIDPADHYVTCPLSNEAIVGLRTMDSLTCSREGLRLAGVRHVRARASVIDADKHRVILDHGGAIAFDRCVVAPGIRFLWGTPEGYDEVAAERMPHAWKAGRQSEILSSQLRSMQDGGVVAISVPSGLMRCPPGPYERASLIAEFLKRHKPRSKVLIFDANNHFPRQDAFAAAWSALYPGMIEWIAMTDGGTVLGVDARAMTLRTAHGNQRVAVANIIPPQAPDAIALAAGLSSGHGWCPVDPVTFESKNVARVHVIGDACIADAMPKSASSAVSQALQCASSLAALLADRTPSDPALDSVCYSLLAHDQALSIHGKFAVRDGQIFESDETHGKGAADPTAEAGAAETWYRNIVTEAFGG